MDIFIAVVAIIAGLVGIFGSIAPGLPGPPVSWFGLMLLYFWGSGVNSDGEPMSSTLLLVMLGVTIAVCIIDYIVPIYFTKLSGGSKYASRGAMAGLILGCFIPPVGMILGAFIGAFLTELYYARKSAGAALRSALGSFAGFMAGTGLKLIAACMMLWYIVVYAW